METVSEHRNEVSEVMEGVLLDITGHSGRLNREIRKITKKQPINFNKLIGCFSGTSKKFQFFRGFR